MFRQWLHNVRQILMGRPTWSAEREFAYYGVTPENVLMHALRQLEAERSDFAAGMALAESLSKYAQGALSGAAVLDLGAGEGFLAQALAFRLGARAVVALDAVPKQIWSAAARCEDQRLRFIVGDASNLPYESASFDVVTCHLVLHHIEPLGPVISEIARVLRPGGQALIMEPAPLLGMLVHEQVSANEAPIPARKVRRAFESVGLTDIQQDWWWSRYGTGLLGPFSPNYRVRVKKAGEAPVAQPRLRRPLRAMDLPGLEIDEGCPFSHSAEQQAREILACWPTAEVLPEFGVRARHRETTPAASSTAHDVGM